MPGYAWIENPLQGLNSADIIGGRDEDLLPQPANCSLEGGNSQPLPDVKLESGNRP